MVSLLELAGGLGGSVLLAVIIFLMYRKGRDASENRLREDRKFMEDRLTKIIEADQETREANTKVMSELITLLRGINGRLKK